MPGYGGGGGGQVIDLRGAPTGLEGIGDSLAGLIGALSDDPNDKIRAAMIENPEVGRQAAFAYREWQEQTKSLPGDALNKVGNANVSGAAGLPPMPGNGLIPPEIMAEMASMFPATREEEVDRAMKKVITPEEEAAARARPTQVATAFGREVTATEEAGVAATELRTSGTEATLGGVQATRTLDLIGAMERAGITVEKEAEMAAAGMALQAAKMQFEAAGLELDQKGLDDFARMYQQSNAQDREIMTAGLAGPRGALFGQALLQREGYNREVSLAGFRASLANAKSPQEVLEAQFELKTKIRVERDRIFAQLEDAPKEQLPGLIEDAKDLAADLLRVDPGAVAQIIRGDPGWVGTETEKVRFDITDITRERGDMLEVGAHMLAQENLSDGAIKKLRESLTDKGTGVPNERMFLAIIERANHIKTATDTQQAADDAAKAAEQAWMDYVSNPRAVTKAATGEVSQSLEQKLTQAIAGDASPTAIAELSREIQKQRQYEFFLSGGPGRVRMDSPPAGRPAQPASPARPTVTPTAATPAATPQPNQASGIAELQALRDSLSEALKQGSGGNFSSAFADKTKKALADADRKLAELRGGRNGTRGATP